MKKILIVNCGSSSLKYQLFDMENEASIVKGEIIRIGLETPIFKAKFRGISEKFEISPLQHQEAIKMMLQYLIDKNIINSINEISAIGHRVVHGGSYAEPVKIDNKVISDIKYLGKLAPLHNPIAATGMQIFSNILPNKPQVAVFDTSFHQSMSAEEYLFPIPDKYSKECRRYGAHGINHEYVVQRLKTLNNGINRKTIVCHLGNGSSLCAVDINGKSVDTTMGLGPLGGLFMGTRSGDLDPTVIKYIADAENCCINNVIDILNNKSGMLALSGISSDFKTVLDEAKNGNLRALKSLKKFHKITAKYISNMEITLQGYDVLAFTAGIGENSPEDRKGICDLLKFRGVEIDENLNSQIRGKEMKISKDTSSVDIYVIPAGEELMIARKTANLLSI